MRTHGMHSDYAGMTFPTVHRIKPAPVPALCADVAIEAYRRAVRSAFEVSYVDFVAIVARVLDLGVGCLQPEQQAGDENGERLAHGNVVDWCNSTTGSRLYSQ